MKFEVAGHEWDICALEGTIRDGERILRVYLNSGPREHAALDSLAYRLAATHDVDKVEFLVRGPRVVH